MTGKNEGAMALLCKKASTCGKNELNQAIRVRWG